MPDLDGLSEAKQRALDCWHVEMKRYRDRKTQERMDANNAVLGPDDEMMSVDSLEINHPHCA